VKSLWVATGVVVGLGIAGIVATTGQNAPSRTIVGDSVVEDTMEDTAPPSATSTTVPGSTTTMTGGATPTPAPTVAVQGIVNLAPTTVEVTLPPAPTPIATAASTTSTSTTVYWHTVGDQCSTVGELGFDAVSHILECTAGESNTWRRL